MDGVAESLQTCYEAAGLGGFGPAVEVIGTEVAIELAADQHVIDDGQDGGGERADRLLGAAASAQAMKLRPEIARLLARGGPGALDEGGLN